ncbi:MAG: hypothetical protein WAW59_05170 [Patescibacteria group bacterium]
MNAYFFTYAHMMKIAYIHNDVKEATGASYINTLIVLKLREK